jgi:hypothetical protein
MDTAAEEADERVAALDCLLRLHSASPLHVARLLTRRARVLHRRATVARAAAGVDAGAAAFRVSMHAAAEDAAAAVAALDTSGASGEPALLVAVAVLYARGGSGEDVRTIDRSRKADLQITSDMECFFPGDAAATDEAGAAWCVQALLLHEAGAAAASVTDSLRHAVAAWGAASAAGGE